MAKSERLLDAIQDLAVYRKEGKMVSHSSMNVPRPRGDVLQLRHRVILEEYHIGLIILLSAPRVLY